MQEEKYIEVQDVEDAEFWIPTYDERFVDNDNVDKRVVLGIPYKLFKSQYDGEIAIIDETGDDITLWHYHRGYFIKKVDT